MPEMKSHMWVPVRLLVYAWDSQLLFDNVSKLRVLDSEFLSFRFLLQELLETLIAENDSKKHVCVSPVDTFADIAV